MLISPTIIALNSAVFCYVLSIPGMPAIFKSEWGYRHRHWFQFSRLLGAHLLVVLVALVLDAEFILLYAAPCTTLIASTHEIRRISRKILAEKISDAEMTVTDDTDAKRDIMSILVRARRAEKGAYALTDEELVEQMVRPFFLFISMESS